MPYYTKVGLHRPNKFGVAARGWHIWRRGLIVQTEFGPIAVSNGRPKIFRWAATPTTDGQKRFRSVANATVYSKRMIREKERDGYLRLPVGQKIRPSIGVPGVRSLRFRWNT